MRLKKREPSGREKDQKAIELLEQLREKVYNNNPSVARHAAFNLSWMQEDGLEILKEALYGSAPKATKGAAAYGLRKMRGRMKKVGMGLLEEGIKHSNNGTRQVCERALKLAQEVKKKKPDQQQQKPEPGNERERSHGKPKFRISEISHESRRRTPRHDRRNPPRSPRFNR